MRSPFVSPRWLGLHVLLVVSVGVFGRIGWWQWQKAGDQGDWQNYGYGVQWWLFGAFAAFLYVKLVLDELDPERVEERQRRADDVPDVVARPSLQQPLAPVDDGDDDELAAYNRHLAWLAQQEQW